jgi:hypothetical protein
MVHEICFYSNSETAVFLCSAIDFCGLTEGLPPAVSEEYRKKWKSVGSIDHYPDYAADCG